MEIWRFRIPDSQGMPEKNTHQLCWEVAAPVFVRHKFLDYSHALEKCLLFRPDWRYLELKTITQTQELGSH